MAREGNGGEFPWNDPDYRPPGGGADYPPYYGGWLPSTPGGEGGWVPPYYDPYSLGPYMGGGGEGAAPGDVYAPGWTAGGWGRTGGGGGGGGGEPELPAWEGEIPAGAWPQYGLPSALPWGAWEAAPWAGVPEGRGPEAMQWMNTVLPWYQQQAAWQQFAEQMAWSQERLRREQEWQAAQNLAQRQAEQELGAMGAFGRRWRPQTRWM